MTLFIELERRSRMFGKQNTRNTLYLVFIAVGFGVTVCGSREPDNRGQNEVHSEVPCLSRGGMCVRAYDCPDYARMSTKGLCPVQQKNGVECCYSLPLSETRCEKRGGECRHKRNGCPENLTFKSATDCARDHKCCIVV